MPKHDKTPSESKTIMPEGTGGPSCFKTNLMPAHSTEGAYSCDEEGKICTLPPPEPRCIEREKIAGREPPRTRKPPRALRIEREGAERLVVPLYPDRTYVFGRAPEASFVFPADTVSRLHAQLRHDGERWIYRDLNSRNGSYLIVQQPVAGQDLRKASRKMRSQYEHFAMAGETVLLGNGASRLVFLGKIPEGHDDLGGTRTGTSPATERLLHSIEVSARHKLPVFLLGPSGSGKTFVARAIHERARMQGEFIVINCGRLPREPSQLASELLGHVMGAFTGAVARRTGKLWSADRGTLFLDEADSLPAIAQDFLIDVLEGSGSYAPLGASGEHKGVPPRFRLISALKVPLARSGLRADLCQRLAAGDVMVLPTLEERRGDIPGLIDVFLSRLRSEQQIEAELSMEAVTLLQEASWPGQIRELETTVKTVVCREHAAQLIHETSPELVLVGVDAVRAYLEQRRISFVGNREPGGAVEREGALRKRPSDLTLEDLEEALYRHDGNKTRTAAYLGIALNTLKAKMRELEVGEAGS